MAPAGRLGGEEDGMSKTPEEWALYIGCCETPVEIAQCDHVYAFRTAIAEAKLQERERCAKVADANARYCPRCAGAIADAIRHDP